MYIPFLSKPHASRRFERRHFFFPDLSDGDYGGGPFVTIPNGHPFAGRKTGGGTRDQIYGTRTYGSGYPGIGGRGVVGRPFPFWFWPVVWSSNASQIQPYLDGTEYGHPSNKSRVGGPLMDATYTSNSNHKTTLHVIADSITIDTICHHSVVRDCLGYIDTYCEWPSPFDPNSQHAPKPDQAIQYYRASSVVLTLDGYHNSATFSSNESVPDSPLPKRIDMNLLKCMNRTIGAAIPLGHNIDDKMWYEYSMIIGMCLTVGPIVVLMVLFLVVMCSWSYRSEHLECPNRTNRQ